MKFNNHEDFKYYVLFKKFTEHHTPSFSVDFFGKRTFCGSYICHNSEKRTCNVYEFCDIQLTRHRPEISYDLMEIIRKEFPEYFI